MDSKCLKVADQKIAEVNYSAHYLAKLLHHWNFSVQKPAFRAYEQSPEQVRQWLEEQYPAIKRKARKQHGTIFWLDETGMRSPHHLGTSFAPKVKRP